MRRTLWLAVLAVSVGAATSVPASFQEPAPGTTAPAAAPPAAPTGSKIWVGRYQEFEEFLRTAEIERTTTVSVGVLGIRRAYFTPGGPAASGAMRSIKPGKYDGFWESYKSEVAAYKLDRLLELDMVPPTVERRYNGEAVSLQVWGRDLKMLGAVQAQKLRPANLDDYSFQLRRQKVFHNLVGNPDPNQGNILFDPVWNVILVDFSRAFPMTRTLKFDATAIDRTFLDRVKALDRETLKREIGDLLQAGAVEAILMRRDDIVKAFEKQAKEKGASQVFLP